MVGGMSRYREGDAMGRTNKCLGSEWGNGPGMGNMAPAVPQSAGTAATRSLGETVPDRVGAARGLRRFGALAGVTLLGAALSVGLSACAAESPDAASAEAESAVEEAESLSEAEATPSEGGADGADNGADDNGRAFDSEDDAVITAIEAALSGKNPDARWEGDRLVVHLDGSAEDPTAWLGCTAALALIAADEAASFVFSDGELKCEDRPG